MQHLTSAAPLVTAATAHPLEIPFLNHQSNHSVCAVVLARLGQHHLCP